MDSKLSLPGEKWKAISGYEKRIQISDYGRVARYNEKKGWYVSKLCLHPTGYWIVTLRTGKKTRTHKVHLEVARAFIANPKGYSIVNHIDGNKLNNYKSNLEWVTQKENVEHAWRTGLNDSRYKAVKQYELSGAFVEEYPSAMAAAMLVEGAHRSAIAEVCKGKRKSAGGFLWEYA